MNEKDYMRITGGIDERFIAEYENIPENRVICIRKRIRTAVLIAAAIAIMVSGGVYAYTQLSHRDVVSIYYSEDGVRKMEESLKPSAFTTENGQIRLTVDVQMCDGNFAQGVYTLTALTEEAREHLQEYSNKFTYADTGEWIYPVGGALEGSVGEDLNDYEISRQFNYPVHNSYLDNSRTIRVVFFESAKPGNRDSLGGSYTDEDYTYFEGIYFDLITEANVPTKTLRADDGTAITLAPYGVSQLDENWAYPDNDVFLDTEIKSIVLTTSDGRRYNIMTTLSDGHVTTDLDDVVVSHSDFDKGNFYITFGTYLDVDSIDSVEINGVTYKE